MSKRTDLQNSLGYHFRDTGLLELALTHRSFHSQNNERLEFLGDALLDLIISEALYQRYPTAREGQMTRVRASLVKGDTLAEIARELRLGEQLNLGSGELKSGGFRRASILADALEAILGAVYLDNGLDQCRQLVLGLYASRIADIRLEIADKDPKTRLQEWLQARKKKLPEYKVLLAEGDAQEKLFQVQCSVGNLCEAQIASGDSKRAAEMAAAEKVLTLIVDEIRRRDN